MKETLRSIESASGVAQAFQADVCDPHQLGVMVREVLASMGSPDLLVNVAGIAIAATILDTSDQDWNRVIGTNLTGPFLLTRAILPLMLDAGSAVIVNVASVAGVVGIPARAAYCASKAGLIGLTRAVAADYASHGVRCIAVCPGTVETEWIDRIIAADTDPATTREHLAARQLDGRTGTADEIAATIAFIASDSGRFFNGARSWSTAA